MEFDAPADELVLGDRDVQRPFGTANPLLNSYLETGLEKELSPLLFRDQIAELLKVRIAGKCPTAAQVAREMGVSSRTMRRRLLGEDSSFQSVLRSVRQSLARTYLREPALGLKEISFLLGYDDVSSFQRAFHAWEGRPPGMWRQEGHPRH